MHEELILCSTSDINLPSIVTLCGISYCDGTYKIERNHSKFGTIEFVTSGTGTIFINGKKNIASQGDAFFLLPESDQLYFSDAKNPWTKIFFNMTGSLMHRLSEEYSFGDKVVFNDCDISSLLMDIIGIFKDNNLTPYQMQKNSLLVIQKIFLQLYEHESNNNNFPSEVCFIKDYIDSHLTDNLSLDDIAQSVYLSKNFIIRLFKKHIGETPYIYYINKKMDLSKDLLLTTSMTIKQIAVYLGFENERYFSYCFRKKYAITPSLYRKNNST